MYVYGMKQGDSEKEETYQAAGVGFNYFRHTDNLCLGIHQGPILGPSHFKVKR